MARAPAVTGGDPIEACQRITALLVAGEAAAAQAASALALAAWPDDPNVLYVAGNCALAGGDDASALACFERSVAAAPRFPAALLNLGFLLRRRHRLDEARAVLRRCVSLAPADANGWLNLTATYVNEGEAAAGEAVAREALGHCPDSPTLHWNLALLLLEQGRWREGWREYVHRFDTPVLRPPEYGHDGCQPPRLRSLADLRAGQTVICHGEQGLGDEILFAGMLGEFSADMRRQGARLVLDCQPRLRTVFARSFAVELAPADEAAAVEFRSGCRGPIDWIVPIGDLPGFYRNDDRDFPDHAGYLAVDPDRVAALRRSLAARAAGRPLVGIAWTGGADWTHARYRCVPLSAWLPVLSRDACFVSLEYRDRAAEIADVARCHGVDIVSLPEITMHDDYDATFHLVAALDLVVTVPTSVLHVAGAVGTPCWILMHERAAWRESSRDAHVPWYPRTHRRFVCPREAADWSDAIDRLAAAFDGWPGQRGRGVSPTA